MKEKKTVVVSGATGFVGKNLISKLQDEYNIIGLSRSEKENTDNIIWRKCNLYSLLEAEKALKNADYAYYLVHSMSPTAKLAQGNFRDFDLIAADNFARAAKHNNVKQIIYLSGIIPENEELSKHLESRLEVEKTLASHDVPLTTLRASLIVGMRGSSFQILEYLVKRLPVMICPEWTLSKTQPIDIDDVIEILKYCLEKNELFNKNFDIGGPDIMRYVDMIKETARIMGYKRIIYNVPLFSSKLSTLWVSTFSGVPKELVKPLIESLKHNMVANNLELQDKMGLKTINYEKSVRKAILKEKEAEIREREFNRKYITTFFINNILKKFNSKMDREIEVRDVRSIQRLPLPKGKNADWVAKEYSIWLPKFLKPFINVERDENNNLLFYFILINKPLLELKYSKERSTSDRSLFYITGGILAKIDNKRRGRLEFREVLNGEFVLSAIHDFSPSIPWFIYNASQALVHLWVMKSFCKYLLSLSNIDKNENSLLKISNIIPLLKKSI